MEKQQQVTHNLPCDTKRKRLRKVIAITNPHYGKNPNTLNYNELLDHGCIILDKPSGPTSHQVVAWVKDILAIQKAGHGGTLDPAATGILPIALGTATNSLQILLTAGKEYVALLKLHKRKSPEKIKQVCNEFIGEIAQIPPIRSAVKRIRRKRQIYYLNILEIQNTEVLFQVGCEAGTYIRTLCVDIGEKLNTRAHLEELRRTRVGCLREDSLVTLHQLKDASIAYQENKNLSIMKQVIHPMEELFTHLPHIIIRDSAVDALCHGANLAFPGVVELDSDIKKHDFAAVFTLKNEIVALVRCLTSSEEILQKETGICAELIRVFMKKGTYPSLWKRT